MPHSTRRRITLLDLLILIAAFAAGLALLRISISGLGGRALSRRPGALTASYITMGQTYASCFLPPLSLAVLALSLLEPRASFRRLARTPGFIACAAAITAVILYSVVSALQIALGKLLLDPANLSRIMMGFAHHAPLMIAGGWLSLALAARWRAETSWVGWAGRILGFAWIGIFLVGWIRVFI
jgi:hypothetical protein